MRLVPLALVLAALAVLSLAPASATHRVGADPDNVIALEGTRSTLRIVYHETETEYEGTTPIGCGPASIESVKWSQTTRVCVRWLEGTGVRLDGEDLALAGYVVGVGTPLPLCWGSAWGTGTFVLEGTVATPGGTISTGFVGQGAGFECWM